MLGKVFVSKKLVCFTLQPMEIEKKNLKQVFNEGEEVPETGECYIVVPSFELL